MLSEVSHSVSKWNKQKKRGTRERKSARKASVFGVLRRGRKEKQAEKENGRKESQMKKNARKTKLKSKWGRKNYDFRTKRWTSHMRINECTYWNQSGEIAKHIAQCKKKNTSIIFQLSLQYCICISSISYNLCLTEIQHTMIKTVYLLSNSIQHWNTENT